MYLAGAARKLGRPCGAACGRTKGAAAGGTRPTAAATPNTRSSIASVMIAPGKPSPSMRPRSSTTMRPARNHCQVEIVQDGDHGHAARGAALGRIDHVELMAQVEARGRLVEQQHPRAVRRLSASKLNQHAGEMRALLLASRQRGDHAVVEIVEVDLIERSLDEIVDLAAATIAGAHAHDFRDGEGKRHADALREHARCPASARGP